MTRRVLLSLTAWVLATGLAFTGLARASQIPIGLDWRSDVSIQEYWVDGQPQYCLSNLRDKDVRITASRFHSPDAATAPLAHWSVPAGGILCADARPLLGERFLSMQMDETLRLGLLRGPKQPQGQQTRPASVSSLQGLNGSCRDLGIILEQDQLWLTSGQEATLVLSVPAHKGMVIIPKSTDDDLTVLVPRSVTCETLPVQTVEDQIFIDTDQPLRDQSRHSVQLHFTVPTVIAPAMGRFSAKIRISDVNWGCFVRGILIKP